MKEPTEKQLAARRKFAEASRLRAAQRKANKQVQGGGAGMPAVSEPKAPEPQTTIAESDYASLQRQVLELKAMLLNQTPNQVGLRGGTLIGSLEKYSLAPTDYPDPIARLLAEPRLARFALHENYDMNWRVTTVEYETIDHVRIKEPRFTLELGRLLYDEETGEPQLDSQGNQKAYIISRLIMHEDPEAAMVIARNEDISIDETNEKLFLDEMRYLRCRDWLLECFFPTPIKKMEKKDMVVGGKVVETYTITSTNSEKIPFDEIKGKMLRN